MSSRDGEFPVKVDGSQVADLWLSAFDGEVGTVVDDVDITGFEPAELDERHLIAHQRRAVVVPRHWPVVPRG